MTTPEGVAIARTQPAEGPPAGVRVDRWLELFELGIAPDSVSEDDLRRVRILSIATLAMCAIGALSFWRYWQLGMGGLCAGMGATMALAMANLALLRARPHPRASAHIGLALLASLLVFSLSNTGGFYDVNFSWFYVLPICAAILVDRRGAAVWTAVTLAITVAFWTLPQLGVVLPNHVPESLRAGQALFNRTTAILAIGLIGGSFVAGQRRSEWALARANRDLRRESAYVQLLQHAAVAANEASSFEDALRESVARICTAMHWDLGHVFLLRPDGLLEPTGRVSGDDGRFPALIGRSTRRFQPGDGLPGRVLLSGRPERVDDLDAPGLQERAREARRAGMCSAFAVPVMVSGEARAVLEFASSTPLPEEDQLFEVFTHIAAQLGRVAERTALQQRIRQSQKLEAIGQLAAGLAHEINNPMSYVRSNLGALAQEWEALRSKLGGSLDAESAERLDECSELVGESLEGVERTIAILRDVKEFSHSGATSADWQPGDLSEIVEAALRVASSQAPSGIRFERVYGGPFSFECSPHQLRQVFVNLIVNAIQAVGESGVIRLVTGRDGPVVFAGVEDDGPGISADVRERLFDPFFTTKPVGEGTGLGLYVSYEIVRSHGGEIGVDSEPGSGARFEVRIPIRKEAGGSG